MLGPKLCPRVGFSNSDGRGRLRKVEIHCLRNVIGIGRHMSMCSVPQWYRTRSVLLTRERTAEMKEEGVEFLCKCQSLMREIVDHRLIDLRQNPSPDVITSRRGLVAETVAGSVTLYRVLRFTQALRILAVVAGVSPWVLRSWPNARRAWPPR